MTLTAYARSLARLLAPYRGTAALVGVLLGVDVLFSAAWPLSFKYLIDRITRAGDPRFLTIAVGALFGAVLVASVAAVLRDYGYALLGSRVLRDVRRSVFEHLQKMSLAFFMQNKGADLLARFSSDLALLEGAITSSVAGFLLGTAGIAISAALLFLLEWRLACLTLVGLALCVLLPRPLVRAAAEGSYRIRQLEGEVGVAAQENIGSQPVIKAFGLGGHFNARFARLTETLANHSVRFKFMTYLVERVPNVVIITFEVMVVGLGLIMVAHGQRTLGTIIAFHGVFLNVVYSVQTLTLVMPGLLQSVGGMQRVEELMNEPPGIVDSPGAKPLPPLRDAIRFTGVSFSYGGPQRQLEGVTLAVARGSFVAFVGASGSGKSTLFNLLLRFYDPDAGSVSLDGTDVRQATVASLRGHMGVVFQNNHLFDVSLRENIRMGLPTAGDPEVEAAARLAEIHDWIASLPLGYDSPAGEGGARLSGGQRQRVAIARALVRQPSILLLDEATSALDPAAESDINATLRRLAVGRTVISVTHRLSSVQDADSIHVMEAGRLAESGTPRQLLASGGAYAKLWRRQSGFVVNEQGDDGGVRPERLKDYPLLSQLDQAALEELAGLFVSESYPAGQSVVVQGEVGDRFHLIARGRVEVVREEAGAPPARVAVLGDGDYFGEVALLRRVPRTATVRTLAPTLLLSLRDRHFQLLLSRHPELAERLRSQSMSHAPFPAEGAPGTG
jgi:ATP-binding cassette subfamily B protein